MTQPADAQSLAALVREYRLTAGLTQEQLAERAGISARAVSDLERGLYQAPHRDTIVRLVTALALQAADAARLEAAVVRQRGPSGAGPQQRGRGAAPAGSAQLPTGLVTLLSMEVEDIEHLKELAADELRAALDRHDADLQRGVASQHGLLVPSPDGVNNQLAVFTTALEAVLAAIDIQHAFREQRWPAGVRPRLRLAVHTGQADVREGNYYGSALNRCARLKSLAAGGRTLVSEAASEQIRGVLPAGATLRDFGEYQLSDLARAEHIFELTTQGAPSHAPQSTTSAPLSAHYDTVYRGFVDGRVVVFAGDAINQYGRTAGASWHRGQIEQLPTSSEVATSLAGRFDYPDGAPQELARVAQYISTMVGSGPLFEELHRIFNADYPPTGLHQFLASVPSALARGSAPTYPLIVTSSYDDALERAFAAAGEPFDLVSYVAEGTLQGHFLHHPPDARPRLIDKPNKYVGLSFERRTIILKVYGTTDRSNAEHDSYVVTEDHFLDYLTGDLSNTFPVTIAARLRRSHFLFLGYRLQDWNLRLILRRLWGAQRLSYKSWAVHLSPPDAMERGLWRDRGVDVLDEPLEQYLSGLRRRFQQRIDARD